MAETGQRVGDYEILAPLGVGGMGRVYKVRNVISNREEAMKILLPDFASDPDLAARFMAEIRTLAGLDHPGIAQLRTAFQHNNQFVMVMEFVEGTTLEKLAAQTRIPLDHLLDYASQALAALSYAHSRGVTHRDIKPANIMITTHGVIKLMDFGIAKSTDDMQLTRPGTTMGSVYYMSPEQVKGGTVDARSDLYSFGVTLYEMLTGRKPFEADTSYSVLNAQLNEAPRPLVELDASIPAELNAIVLHAMEKAPEQRFQTAEEFRAALKALRQAPAAGLAAEAAAVPPMAAMGQGTPPVAVAAAPYSAPIPPPAAAPQYTAAQPPPFTPVPAAPGPAPRAAKSRRGLWIGLGAVTAILALVAVAWVLPRIFSTSASQKPAASDATAPASSPAPAAASQAETPAAPAATTPQPAASASEGGTAKPPAASPGAHTANASTAASDRQPRAPYNPPATANATSAGSTTAAAVPAPAPSGPSPQELHEAHNRYDNLESRADAVFAGVDQLRSQQQAQGLDMRGDILASVNRLHHQLDQARQALAANDLDTANDSMSKADAETTRLEKFLGR